MRLSKRPKSIWTTAFPQQVQEGQRERKDREYEAYRKEARAFVKAHPWCKACKIQWTTLKPRRTKDVHHTRGRSGELLRDQRYWMPVCRQCHNWIGNNIAEARKLGLIDQKGKWNDGKRR